MRRQVRSRAALLVGPALLGSWSDQSRAQWTAVPMNPSGVFSSGISAVTPTVQGGLVSTAPGTPYLPAYWNGSASSWVSLGTGAANEAGAVNGVLGDTEAGFLFVNSVQRASLWHGS